MKLSNIFTIAFVAIVIISSALLTGYFFAATDKILEDAAVAKLQIASESRASHIETYLLQNIERLKLITSRTKLRETLAAYNENPNETDRDTLIEIIKDASNSLEEIQQVCIIGLDGNVIASNSNDCKTVETVVGTKLIEDGKNYEKIFFINLAGEYKIFTVGPIVLKDKLLGVGLTVASLEKLRQIIRDRTGLGKTGEVLVAIGNRDERGYLFERLFETEALTGAEESAATAEPIKQALDGNQKVFLYALDYRDEPVIAISEYIKVGQMGLVAKIDVSEAIDAPKEKYTTGAELIIIAIIILVSIIAVVFSILVSRPLTRLTNNVNEISKGKLDIKLDDSNIREIQDLTSALKRVLASLKIAILRTSMEKNELELGSEPDKNIK